MLQVPYFFSRPPTMIYKCVIIPLTRQVWVFEKGCFDIRKSTSTYTCTCTFISTWDIKAYFSFQSHVKKHVLCVETMGLKIRNCAASYLCPACGPRLVPCCQRALTPSAAPNQTHHHWPENSCTSPLQSHTQAHLYLLHTDKHII